MKNKNLNKLVKEIEATAKLYNGTQYMDLRVSYDEYVKMLVLHDAHRYEEENLLNYWENLKSN